MHNAFPLFAYGHSSQVWAEVVFGVGSLATLTYCLKLCREDGVRWPLYVWLGALITPAYEPVMDVFAHVAFPQVGQHTVITLLGRKIPVAAVLLYTSYIPLGVSFLMRWFERGMTKRQLWTVYGTLVVVAACFEPLFVNPHFGLNWWHYYGTQVLNFTGLPMWWWFVNPLVWLAPAALFHMLRMYGLKRDDRKTWIFIPGCPLAVFIGHGSASLPMYLAIGSGAGDAVQLVCLVLSAGIAMGYFWLIGETICVQAPPTSPVGVRGDPSVEPGRLADPVAAA